MEDLDKINGHLKVFAILDVRYPEKSRKDKIWPSDLNLPKV